MKPLRLLGIIIFLLIPCLSAQDAKILKFEIFLRDMNNDKYFISHPDDMTFDREESVYILDAQECNILKFSSNGEFITSIGIKEKNPGGWCLASIKMKDEKLYYISTWNFINIYTTNGKLIKSTRKEFTPSSIIRTFPEKFIIGEKYDGPANRLLLTKWNWDGDETDVIDEISYDKYLKTSKTTKISAIAATNADGFTYAIDGKGALIYAKTDNYEVYKWIDGKKETIIKEKHPYKLLPNEKRKKNRLEKKKSMTTFYISNDYYQFISEIMVDKEDNIWLVTNLRDRAGLVKYSNDGKFIAFYEIEPWYLIERTKFYMSDNYLYCSEGTSEGYKIYRAQIPK